MGEAVTPPISKVLLGWVPDSLSPLGVAGHTGDKEGEVFYTPQREAKPGYDGLEEAHTPNK